MSNIMKPPPEYSAPPTPNYARVPGSYQQPRKSYRWAWITLGILALVCFVTNKTVDVLVNRVLPQTWPGR